MADTTDESRRYADDDEQDADEINYKAQKDAILFAIEVSDSMLEEPPSSNVKKMVLDSPVRAALKCAYHLMQQRIISNPKDMMGILLFGTKKTKFRESGEGRSGSGYPNCYLLTDLDVPAAEDVKALKALAEEGEDDEEILTAAPAGSASMANVLFCANQIFTTKAANFGSRRLFIVTDNDDPHGSDKAAKSAAAVRAKDLYDLGITIDLFPVVGDDSEFQNGKFYDDIIYHDPESGSNGIETLTSKSGDGLTLLKSLISNINSKQTPKRSQFNIPFEVAPGLRIAVKGYNVLHRQTPARTCYIWLDDEKAQIATSETTRIADDSARTVEKQEVKKAYKFGGEYVYFTPEEHKTLGDFGSPMIRIIGFKPREDLSKMLSIKKATFIHPNEEDVVGSSRVFSALWKKLLSSKKIGIAWCLLRSNSAPMLAAIFPSLKTLDEDEGGEGSGLPDGLWVYPLAMADDLREVKHNPPEQRKQCSDELIDDMMVVIQQLKLPKGVYDPKKYPNPALQWHYEILQALALESEIPSKAEDFTKPKNREIAKRAGGYIRDWAKRLRQDDSVASTRQGLKREADDELPKRPAKQMKATPLPPAARSGFDPVREMSTLELSDALEAGRVDKMTVVQLRGICENRGLSTLGKKADLLERIERSVFHEMEG